jgi:hypothetical protein
MEKSSSQGSNKATVKNPLFLLLISKAFKLFITLEAV